MGSRTMGAGMTLLAALALTACDDTTGPAAGEQVAVAFSTTGSGTAGTQARVYQDGHGARTLQGTNGTLVIEDLRIIVAEFELERLNTDECVEEDDACEKFEAPPAFVAVPLDGGQVVAITAAVDPDTYDELEFEIEDLEDDEENPVLAQQIAELRAEILAEFPDWPQNASVLVTGTFTPTDGEPVAFRTFLEAEVEIEMDLSPPVTIADDGTGATFTVNLDPGLWFSVGDGTVLDLSAYDYDRTGQLLEFELEIENGFSEIEFEED